MPPPPLNLTTFRVKKVFTNDINDGYISGASANDRSAIESISSGPSSGFPSNLERSVTSPILERPLRIKRRIKKVIPVVPINNELESESSQPIQTPLMESDSRGLSETSLIMNLDGSVKSPHRKPALIIRRKTKKTAPQEFDQDAVDAESSNPSQPPCAEPEPVLEALPTSKRRLKHRGFALARGQDLEEAMRNWSAVEAEPDLTTEKVEEAYESDSVYSQASEYSHYGESLVDPWLNTKRRKS
ncbi:uncharacterized protein MELLADRAFT_105025 [Melampsora larici-populina 98AG31]|uniref:Uncharacterized protein n=1 Tax=Melampsora larici-populina (strain 98AG31 / pathotype 3-4-7) TaxID=747676 RepID=F4RGP6_MELLP|nr:uncharacterized protein MELLADRAFT_105025 [Melampsora larici-populina 98AG31]EGG08569.1 hypothetical protein MELLADRAFT_105025 [Melampsora larici-populina 98AG31]